MLELVKAGGWPMIPLLLLSAVALAIIVERFWALRRKAVLPPGLGGEVRAWASRGNLDPAHIETNIVIFDMAPGAPSTAELLAALAEHGVKMNPVSARRVRAVTHYGIEAEDIEAALAACREVLQ